MTNREDNPKERDLDRTLDAALAKYASVEPREGLEERILANVRAAGTRRAQSAWRNCGFAVVAAALAVVAVAMWHWNKPMQTPIANRPSMVKQAQVGPDLAHQDGNSVQPIKSARWRRTRHRSQHETVAANPKLDVFPSPLPLSEQEKILAGYVSQYPQHAALVAEARMDDLRQETEERRRIASERDERQ